METGVKSKFIRGVLWGIIEKFASIATGFVITIVLARILTPEDYGLVNMIYIFTVLGNVLLDGGFGQALIQKNNITDTDKSSVFYINIALSAIVYFVLFLCAPSIAEFYHQPSLVEISRVVFLIFPINAFCIIQHTLLTKELCVKELTYVSIISSLVSGIIGITLAYLNFGVWALVVQSVSYQLARCITLWFFSKWRPILEFSWTFIRSIFNFSMHLLGVFSIAAIFQNIYTLLIGKLYSVADVGYYNQAFRIQSVASNAVTSAIDRVAFPAFSQFQDDIQKLKGVYRRVNLLAMSIYFPFMMCLAVVSKSLFVTLLTAKWLPSVPLFCLLCIAESLYPLKKMNSAVLKALGKGKTYFRLNMMNYGINIISIIVSYKYGIFALLCGFAVSSLICSIISMAICGRAIGNTLFEQIKDLFPVILQTMLICIFASIGNILPIHPALRLIASLLLGFVIFVAINYISKSIVYIELKNLKN